MKKVAENILIRDARIMESLRYAEKQSYFFFFRPFYILDSSTIIHWTSLFVILRVSDLSCRFY